MATYYIADCHFGHKAVIGFDHRPFSSVEEMEDVMVMFWNAAVHPSDTIYILGDFCFGTAEEWLRLLRRLNGHKILVRGNHDIRNVTPELQEQFVEICNYKEVSDNGRKVILSHYPILFYNHSFNPKWYMLCGHIHNTLENDYLEAWKKDMQEGRISGRGNCAQVYNVGTMMPWMNYTPRTLDEILRWPVLLQQM